MKKMSFLVIGLLLLSIVAMSGCADNSDSDTATPSEDDQGNVSPSDVSPAGEMPGNDSNMPPAGEMPGNDSNMPPAGGMPGNNSTMPPAGEMPDNMS